MPLLPLSVVQTMTQQQGADTIAAIQIVQTVIGLLSSPDPNSANAKLNSIIASLGTGSTAGTLLKYASDTTSGLGVSTSSAATSPTSSSTAIGFLKLISSYLQTMNKNSSVCTKATAALTTTSGPIITSGVKNIWMIANTNSSPIYIEYGAAATVAGGIPIYSQMALIDDFDFTGAINGIVATGTLSVDYRVFTT